MNPVLAAQVNVEDDTAATSTWPLGLGHQLRHGQTPDPQKWERNSVRCGAGHVAIGDEWLASPQPWEPQKGPAGCGGGRETTGFALRFKTNKTES